MSKANKIAAIGLLIMAVMIAGTLVMVSRSSTSGVRSYFDNGSGSAVKIEMDGKEILSLPAHSASAYEGLMVGSHKLRVLDDQGKVVEEGPLEVPSSQGIALHRWVYNVSKRSRYEVSYVAYGKGASTPDKPHAVGEGQLFFELPSTGACFLPAEMPSDKGKAGTYLALVSHHPAHKDWPCCANLRALAEPSRSN